ncbi:unnamed protein product [Adineta steineri]|uniref:AB hydrolase-1 domain-containing protein n=1 Tax=Adineta steineri TaxID=433720 RepID=A0A819HDR3_9BILA|nr:unnamed protein product [Adineta steineri]CAF3896535.1 unnamed protein product [Adineta steineri]
MVFQYIDIAATPVSLVVHSFLGLVCLTILFGFYGTVLTTCRFLRYGRKRFFKKFDRPKPPAKALDRLSGKHEMIKLKSSGVTLHYVSKGVPSQHMILFLHGFPECWYSWRNQMKYFSKDYRVVAVDQRGYGLSSKPAFIVDYKMETLAGDIADLIEQLGYESCILVGHDIGGFVAWTTAMLYPHLVEKLIVMNCPHPLAFHQELSFSQMQRSWFMFFAQTMIVPELYFEADDFAFIKSAFRKKSTGLVNQDYVTDDDIEVFKYTFSQPETTKAAINYYRAFLRYQSDYSRAEVVAPVLMLWGSRDHVFDMDLADASQKYCSDVRLKKIQNGSHWINQDMPDVVNKYMEVFLNEQPIVEIPPEY